jgi:hypothetical protein
MNNKKALYYLLEGLELNPEDVITKMKRPIDYLYYGREFVAAYNDMLETFHLSYEAQHSK